MGKPLLSIITVNFNNVGGLERTILSVIGQTFTNYEYLIIDGGSTDGSVDVISRHANYISYWCSETDKGIYHAMNKGIVRANGNYLLFLNSGDLLSERKILETVFCERRTADIVYGDINYLLSNGSKRRYYSLKEPNLTMAHFFENTIAHPAAFIKKRLFDTGLYDENLRIVADNKFFYERVVFQNCSVEYLDLVVADFDTNGLSSKPENWARTNEERSRVICQLLPPRILKDYELILLSLHSPLSKYLPILSRTSGFQKLVARVVGLLVWIYSLIRFRSAPRL